MYKRVSIEQTRVYCICRKNYVFIKNRKFSGIAKKKRKIENIDEILYCSLFFILI